MTGLRARIQSIKHGVKANGVKAPTVKTGGDAVPHPVLHQVNADRLVDVQELVNWVYSVQKAHLVDGRGIGLHEGERAAAGLIGAHEAGSGSTLHKFEEILRLGCQIKRQGYDMGDLHPVAEVVNALVMKIPEAELIVRFGARAEVPAGYGFDMHLGPSWNVEPRYEIGRDERGDILRDQAGNIVMLPKQGAFKLVSDLNKHALYCPLAWDHGPDYVAEMRAEYLAWHDGLSELVVYCCRHRPKLAGLMVTGPKLLREPWWGPERALAKGVVSESVDFAQSP